MQTHTHTHRHTHTHTYTSTLERKPSPLIVLAVTSALTFGAQANRLLVWWTCRETDPVSGSGSLGSFSEHTHQQRARIRYRSAGQVHRQSHRRSDDQSDVQSTLSTEPFSQSKSTDSPTNLNISLSDRNLHSASLNYSTVCVVRIVWAQRLLRVRKKQTMWLTRTPQLCLEYLFSLSQALFSCLVFVQINLSKTSTSVSAILRNIKKCKKYCKTNVFRIEEWLPKQK